MKSDFEPRKTLFASGSIHKLLKNQNQRKNEKLCKDIKGNAGTPKGDFSEGSKGTVGGLSEHF